MSFGRKAAIWLASSFLTLALFSLAIDTGFVRIAGQPNTIKGVLDKSGLYNSVVPGLLDEAKTISNPNGDIPLNDSVVRSAATSTLTPQYLQTNVNQALDSIYQWLDGKTSQPSFSFNLTDIKNTFADKVAAGARQKAASLPACTAPPTGAAFDVFGATCLPPGITPDQVAAQVRSSIVGGQGFLDNANVSANDLKASGSSQPVFKDQLKNLPKGFREFKRSPVILVLISILFGVLLVFIYPSKLGAAKHIGFIFGGVGIFVILIALGLNEAVSNKFISHINLNNAVLEVSLRRVIHDTVHNLSGTYMLIGVIYILLGALGIGTHYFFNKNRPADAAMTKKPAAAKPAKKVKVS